MHQAIIIGTGFSGICMGIKLKEAGIHDFIILEKASEVGGTWRENTYPGAECDIPSALYSYSFEHYPFWEYKWSHQPQILSYLKHCAEKYGLNPHIRFNQEMIAARFDEENACWYVQTKQGDEYQAQSLISAVGQLHYPSTPYMKGKELFKGDIWHSANWNHDISLESKKVGVVGNAASAVQFIPQIAPVVEKLTVFQRSANWMIPKPDRPYKKWEKKLSARIPFLLRLYRQSLWLKGGVMFLLMGKNKFFKKLGEAYSKNYIKRSVKDPELRKKLMPDYPIGAKRILFSDDYYLTFNRENVELIDTPIQEMTESGIRLKEGKEIPLDVVIFATGFKTNPFLMGLDIEGLKGQKICEAWKEGAEAYLGITTSGFPNFFMMYGPNTNLGHNSIVIMSECQAKYITQCIVAWQKNKFKYLNLKPEVQQKYNEKIQKRLANSAWDQIADSWYKSGNKITNNWPGRTMEYDWKTRKVKFSVFEMVK